MMKSLVKKHCYWYLIYSLLSLHVSFSYHSYRHLQLLLALIQQKNATYILHSVSEHLTFGGIPWYAMQFSNNTSSLAILALLFSVEFINTRLTVFAATGLHVLN